MRCSLSAILVFVFALLRLQAAPAAVGEIPFQYREGLLWVDVNISGSRKPLHFLLDTGAGASVINLNTARALGMKLGAAVSVHGVGQTVAGYRQQEVLAKAGEIRLPREYLAVDLEKFSKSCQQPVDGLIGMDFFRRRVVQIDFDARKIRLLKPQPIESITNVLPLELRSCGMCVPITVEDHLPQWVRLDTGCATSLHWIDSKINTDQCLRQTAIGLAEISVPQIKTTVELCNFQFKDVPTSLHESAIFPGEAGLLGNGLLSRFSSVIIDGKRGRLMLGELRTQE